MDGLNIKACCCGWTWWWWRLVVVHAPKHAPGHGSATELGKFDFSYPQACVLTGVVLRTLKQSLWELCENEVKI